MAKKASKARETFTGPELCRKSAYDTVALLRAGEITPLELVEAAAKRIAVVEPVVNAMPTVCLDRARAAASAIGQAPKHARKHRAWLAGLPISIKDLTAVKGVRSTWGTRALADYIPEASDPLVERLEARGGIVMGKSNTPEMGAGGNTFNDVFGMTRNPFDSSKNAGGSSGGAAVSVATGEVWLAHGSDLAGSLRTPAAYCGVVGMRPTPGRAGGAPADLAFSTEGVQGPMARNVLDTALFLDAMAGFDPRQVLSIEEPRQSFQAAVLGAKRPARIAYAPSLNGFAPLEAEIEQVLAKGLGKLEPLGTAIEEACPDLTGLESTYVTVRAMFWAALVGRQPEELRKHFKRTLRDNIALGFKLTVEQVYEAQYRRSVLFSTMQEFLTRYDALACAVVGLEPGAVEEEYPRQVAGVPTGDYLDWLRLSFLATVTGLPAIVLPVGRTRSGMPVGIQLIGPPRGEAKLLAIARVLEDAVGFSDGLPIDPVRRH